MLSFDYARQLDVPLFGDETTESYWEHKEALDVNLFVIVNESGNGKFRFPYLLREGAKSGSDSVCSLVLHWIKTHDLCDSKKLSLCSDSCTGQNKSNMFLSFLSLLVGHEIILEVDLRFLAF